MLSKTFKAFLSLLLLIGVGHLYYQYTGNFRTDYLLPSSQYDLPLFLPVIDSEKTQEIAHKLDQTFHYAGHGHQTYVFIGDDGETVLKLLMNQFIRSDWRRYLLPPIAPFREWMLHRGHHHDFRLNRLLSGYTLTYTLDPENCGLIYFHVDQDMPPQEVTLVDALGFSHEIQIEEMVFALQQKAVLTKDVLHDHLSKGDIEGAKKRVDQLIFLYQEQFNKGLVDRDRNFLENTGFVDGHPIRIDVGKVVANEGNYMFSAEYDKIINKRLRRWLGSHYPVYSDLDFATFLGPSSQILAP